jgi:hypothetical protein
MVIAVTPVTLSRLASLPPICLERREVIAIGHIVAAFTSPTSPVWGPKVLTSYAGRRPRPFTHARNGMIQ